MKPSRAALWLLAGLMAAASTPAYTPSPLSDSHPGPVTWDLDNHDTWLATVDGGAVHYAIHSAGSGDIGDGSEFTAIQRAFRTWSGVSGSALRFVRDPDTGTAATVNDDRFTLFWSETTTVIDQGTAATDDDVNIAGALAVTFVYRVTAGPEAGEIRDANIVFNGADFAWTTSPETQSSHYDVEAVALHEIGHALGLDHSAVATASMFPRLGAGRRDGRDVSPDDVAGVIALYPGGNSAANRGSLTGMVDSGGPVHGALVWARDAEGRVLAQSITTADGLYRLDSLDPGPIRLHVQPMNDPGGFSMYSLNNLPPYYAASRRNFGYHGDVEAVVVAGAETQVDLTAPPGTPVMDIKLVSAAGSWSNISRSLRRGQGPVRVGVAGPGLPAAGAPLTVSGGDVTYGATTFGSIAGLPAIEVQITVAGDAALGTRDLIVDDGFGRSVALGALEIVPAVVPLETPEVHGLSARVVGEGLDLDWTRTAAGPWYRLLRGDLAGLRHGGGEAEIVSDACFISVPRRSLMGEPLQVGLTYYLVQAVGEDDRGGPLGSASSGLPRLQPVDICP